MACNIYITTESESKLKQLFCNAKDFYMLDVAGLIKEMDLDISKASSVYLINEEIQKIIISKASLKRVHGIFYIVQNLSEQLINTVKQRLSRLDGVVDFVLIDNGYCPKHNRFASMFNDVIFYERFRKNKIIRCASIEKIGDNDDITLLMDEE